MWTSSGRVVTGTLLIGCSDKHFIDMLTFALCSLKSLRLRSIFASTLRKARGDKITQLPPDFVYRFPTAEALAKSLLSLVTGHPLESSSPGSSRAEEMNNMIQRMIEPRGSEPCFKIPALSSKVVVLTGSTGSLGSHLLYHLYHCSDVERIYAINRDKGGDSDALHRYQEDALKLRGIDYSILEGDKIVLIAADLAETHWGLHLSLYQEVSVAFRKSALPDTPIAASEIR